MELTDVAVVKFRKFLGVETNSYVRLSIEGDGCEGFSYHLQIDATPVKPTDFVDDSHGFTLAVDKKSALYLEGTTIDWEDNSDGRGGFHFNNPNAVKVEP